jgi:hypothetical protein
MTAAELLRDLVEALPKSEFWTPKLIKAEKSARAYMADPIHHEIEYLWSICPTKKKRKVK